MRFYVLYVSRYIAIKPEEPFRTYLDLSIEVITITTATVNNPWSTYVTMYTPYTLPDMREESMASDELQLSHGRGLLTT